MSENEANQIVVREIFNNDHKKVATSAIQRTIEALQMPGLKIKKISAEQQYGQVAETFDVDLPNGIGSVFVIICTKNQPGANP